MTMLDREKERIFWRQKILSRINGPEWLAQLYKSKLSEKDIGPQLPISKHVGEENDTSVLVGF